MFVNKEGPQLLSQDELSIPNDKMKPQLIMLFLLRSSAAALATSRVGSGASRGASRGVGGNRRVGYNGHRTFPRRRSSSLCQSSPSDAQKIRRRCSLGAVPPRGDRPLTGPKRRNRQVGGKSAKSVESGHIAFRLARSADVTQIQSCNLATLPENYNANFYVNHMRAWPELTLVAEHVPDGCSVSAEEDLGGLGDADAITPLGEYLRGVDERRQREDDSRPRKEIVGYILGKVEERPIPSLPRQGDIRHSNGGGGRVRFPSPRRPPSPQTATEKVGHITSLAVHSHARRLGIASSLLRQLHYHLCHYHGARSIGLHVRVSNEAAVGLYAEDGYSVANVVPSYYGDGEDAYFMRKELQGGTATAASDNIANSAASAARQGKESRRWRRGEKERLEWLRRNSAPRGSFLGACDRTDPTLSVEAWESRVRMYNKDSPHFSSQFKRGLQNFFDGHSREHFQLQRTKLPPWETGPANLRLPRYVQISRTKKNKHISSNGRDTSLEAVAVASSIQEGTAEDFIELPVKYG